MLIGTMYGHPVLWIDPNKVRMLATAWIESAAV
jgi:hypothetical protein